MKLGIVTVRCLGALLALAAVSTLRADNESLGGPLRAGHGRPPLYLNLTPALSGGYAPAQIRHAYGFDQLSGTGAGQKIGIVDAYGSSTLQSDMNTFCAQFGLPATTIQVLGNSSTVDSTWALETALDVQWAHAIAPNATIIFSAARSSGLNDLLNAVDAAVAAGATAVSMSWGAGEFGGESAYEYHFNVPGVTFTASSGDSGEGVEWPAASPYVLGVGGTTLTLDANSNRVSETAWSGSGGGLSAYDAQPTFQWGWITTPYRAVPDVSLVANPSTGVYVCSGGAWCVVGGTSVAAPQWAGLIGLCNSMRSSGSLNAAGSAIYSTAIGGTTTPYADNGTYVFDVIQGSNGHSAGPGYDLVTGLGAPFANNLVPALASVAGAPADFSLGVAPGSQSVAAGSGASYTVTVSPSSGFSGTVSLSVSGLPSGATHSFTPATVTGSGSSTLTVTAPAGSYTLTITGTSGSLGHSVSASLVVASPGFSISASPSSRSVKPGSSTACTVSVSGTGGFNSPVVLSVTGQPSTATASFSPSSVTGSGSSTLTVSTKSSTPKGTYKLQVTGASGSLVRTTTVSLGVK